jgi:VWFA-related protein
MTVVRTALVALAVLGGTLLTAAQDPQKPVPEQQKPPVFRTGVDMVRVDVYPRRRNRVVPGLTKDDFKILEDGVPQAIETFEYIDIDAEWGTEPLEPRSAAEAQRMAADPRNRVFVFYLDTYEITMEGSYRAREPLLAFLQGSLRPRDLFAWMTPKHSPEYLTFTRMTNDLSTLMSVVKPWGQKDTPVEDPKEMELQGCAPPSKAFGPNWLVQRMRDVEMLTDLKELLIRLGALRQERKNLVILGERWQSALGLPVRAPAPVADARPVLPVRAVQGGRGSFVPPPSPMIDSMRKCSQIEQYLRGKDLREMTREIPILARRHNVALYFVPLSPAGFGNMNLAGSFADETDGRNIVSNDIAQNLDAVLSHQTGFYMLGYRSTAGEAGKKERTVRVQTTAKDVDLDVRRLYLPPPAEFVAARSDPKPIVERTDVQKAFDRLPPLREDRELAMHVSPREGGVDVAVEIAGRVVATESWRAGGSIKVFMRDEAGATLAEGEATFAPGDRSALVKIAVADTSKVSRANASVTAKSGGTLADSVPMPSAEGVTGGIGHPVFYRAGSLPRLPFHPAALLLFGRTERLRIEWPLKGAMANPAVRILNVAGTAFPADITVSQVDGTPAILRADARLLSMAPGEYVIEAAGDVNGQPARYLVAIRVTR